MDLIRWSMSRPVSVSVVVMLVVLFGLIGLTAIPIQLKPTVDTPVVTVHTAWPGRSPEELVDEVTRKQEERLKNVANLKTMRSTSREGECDITLEFTLNADINRALQEVSDALRQVADYPDEVEPPTVEASEGGVSNAIAWLILDLDPAARAQFPDFDVATLFTPVDKEIKPYLERVEGVAQVRVFGGREREVHVLVDPSALAQRSLAYDQVIAALRDENINASAGAVAEGKRDIRVRVLGQYRSPSEILDTVVAYRDARPVHVRDVARVEISHEKVRGFVRSFGEPSLAMPVIRQGGANVVKVMGELRQRLGEVRRDILPKLDPAVGKHLRLRQVYDETVYIDSAIDLVLENLWKGGVLAVITLTLFLRSFRSTGVIALAIPICIIATFLIILAAGRTLNIVSLAGLAFSTGMVVDNAIVVLENITRRRALGDAPLDAVYRGTKEVWTAILASTLTTVCVFIPILTVQEEAGQIFFDLSLAMAVAVSVSVVVAITVVPCACALVFKRDAKPAVRGGPPARSAWQELFGLAQLSAGFAARVGNLVLWLITGWRAWSVRPALILAMTALSILLSITLAPPLDYLPNGNQNLVFGGLLIPPGLSVEQQVNISQRIEAQIKPYLDADIKRPETLENLPPIARREAPDKPFPPVPLDNFFIGAFQGGMFVGGISQDPQRVIPVGTLISNAMVTIPDAFGGAAQASIFGRSAGTTSTLNVEISGPSISRVSAAASMMLFKAFAMPEIGPFRVRPAPANFNLQQPEVQVRLNDAGRELGLRPRDVGTAVRGLFDGAFAGEYIDQGRAISILVKPVGGDLGSTDHLQDVSLSTPAGKIVPLGAVAQIRPGQSPQEIQRIEELPAVSLQITPPEGLPLESLTQLIREQLVAPAEAAGLLDPSMRVRMEGTAAKLEEVKTALFGARHSAPEAPWQRALRVASYLLSFIALGVATFCVVRAGSSRHAFYGAVGALLLGLVLAGMLLGVALAPQLLLARFVWALLVTYLLMCALFESFLYPFVIMFSVPLAMVGGFAALRLVHNWTLTNPAIAPQQLDVLTIIGFVILVGTVVNNAILIVEQALNFMTPGKAGEEFAKDHALAPREAICESVRTRLRPILMTTLTTLGGGLPLVIAPGSGSEMYRGLGAVVCGGLLVSTIFTLVLVPMVFSLVLDMKDGFTHALASRKAEAAARAI